MTADHLRVLYPAASPMPEVRRLELGPPSDDFTICVLTGADFDEGKRKAEFIGPCRIHKDRMHWRIRK